MSLALAQVLFLVGNELPPHTTSCQLVAVMEHFSYLASFFWMNALAIDICRSLATHVFDPGSEHLFLWYSGYAWLCPMLLVGVAVLSDVFFRDAVLSPNYGGYVCWICRRTSLVAFFLAPVASLLVANAVLFIVTARSLRSSHLSVAANRRDETGIPFLLYVKLVLTFGLTWIFGFTAALTSVRWLWYPFIVLSGLQGVYLFLSFACKKTVICDLQQRFFPKKEMTSQKSFPSGLTGAKPLVARERRSNEKKNKKTETSGDTQC
ncbi:probable G-protein coupled receptor Mth-like 1 [Ornithodoros turicata]|uniref:probable G-protein coupled receptor Mth-like 1 n=1 Tax=Ornithodoros turicata TaxID=34597 RepID=UPI0031390809